MLKLCKNFIKVFGEESVSNIVKCRNTYICIRECDGAILAIGKELKGYLDDVIRTMYTGEHYAEGDYILVSDRHGLICKFDDSSMEVT